MGYDFHITRKAQWFEQHGPLISEHEWTRYVATHAKCRWHDVAGRAQEPDDAVHVIDSLGLEVGQLWWQKGELRTKNPPAELISYMIEVANAVGARVMGDEGETFRDANSPRISRAPYCNSDNLTNVWEEPPDGHDDEYCRQQRERWAEYDVTTKKDSAHERAITAEASIEKKAALYKHISTVAAISLLLLMAVKAFK